MKHLLSFLCLVPTMALMGQDDALIAGVTAMRKADHTSATLALDKAVADAPANGRTWYYRAMNRMALGDNDGALLDLDQVLRLDPRDVHALLRRAEVHQVRGDMDLATTDLFRVIGITPTGVTAEHALFELGRMAVLRNDLPAALGHYDRLVVLAADNASAWCERGIVRSFVHDDDNAVADLEKALELDPATDKAHGALAVVYFRQGREQEGCYALHRAHDLGDRSVEELLLLRCDR